MKSISEFIDFVPAFAAQLTDMGCQSATVSSYVSDIRLFLNFLAENRVHVDDLSPVILQQYHLSGELQDNSLRRKIISIKRFFAFLRFDKQLDADPFVSSFIPKRDDSLWGILADDDLQKVFVYLRNCQDLSGLRDSAIIHLLAFEGIKASELVSLSWQHFLPQKRDGFLQVVGNRQRLIRLDRQSDYVLRRYRQQFKQHRFTANREVMFFGRKGPGGAIALERLTRHGLKFLLHKLAEQLGIATLSPQRLRHYAIRYLRNKRQKTVDETMKHLGLKRIGNINRHAGIAKILLIISWLVIDLAQAEVTISPNQCPPQEKCSPATATTPAKPARPFSIPLIFRARDIDPIANYPLRHIRVFRALATGEAIPIPFQIDELNRYGDFLFDSASNSQERGNKIFDRLDELSIMSGDLGIKKPPTKWTHGKPFRLYEVVTNVHHQRNTFYVGIFLGNTKPPLSSKVYVKFDSKRAIIDTANYRLLLNKKNYLAIEEVVFKLPERNMSLIDWSSFYLKLDFKYFLTFEENHESIESKMSAYKSGAIRTIIKIDFILQLLKLKLNPGFFTEMSFFGGSLHLPALVYAPFDNQKILNRGSEMYYGFALVENPNTLHIETNMPRYQTQEESSRLHYWLGVYSPFYAVFVNLRSNRILRANNFAPNLYTTNQAASQLPPTKEIGKRKVNVALYFDLTKFAKGEQRLGFQSFFVGKHLQNNLTASDFASHHLFATSIKAIKQ